MNPFTRWLEAMGQEPRTFVRDALVYVVRFAVVMFVLLSPLMVLEARPKSLFFTAGLVHL